MATGFQPMAGVSGRLKSVVIPDDATTDLPVVGAVVTVTANELTLWSLQRKNATGKVVTVENPADAATRAVSTLRLRGGIDEWTVKIEGVVNADSTAGAASPARLPVGAFIKFDLIRHKGSNFGHKNCVGKIVSDDTTGAEASENPQKFSYTVEGHGLLPAPDFV